MTAPTPPAPSSGSPSCPSTTSARRACPESFASGLTEELITQLGRLCADRLGVIARSSCHRVQRTDRTVREIGDALRAHYLVEGTVRTEADRVRITAQLIEVRGETQLWADSYERPIADSLLVQSDVATQIVRSVAVELLPDRAPDAVSRHAQRRGLSELSQGPLLLESARRRRRCASAWPSTARR